MHKQILIGVAWPYVNGDLHLGHLAGYLLPADIFARYQRLRGNDVLMVSGSDCHGTPITVEADKSGLTPTAVVAKYHTQDLKLFELYKLSYNLYTKTTTENHKKVTQEVFLDLLQNGYIVKDVMQQYYSEADKKFLPDRYVEGTCPYCNAKEQRSDQCESCGRWLADGELLNPVSKLTKSAVTLKDTEHYFLDLEKLTPELQQYVNEHKDIWRHWVWNEADSWLKEGLHKRAITRDMDWAIDLPIEEIKKLSPDKNLTDFQGKKLYVWFEAVIGYLSAAVEWSDLSKMNTTQIPTDVIFRADSGQSKDWKDWWLNPDALLYNFMGQDNLVFHALMWPGQLLGTKRGYTLPYNVVVNKFMNLEGKKFSKSRNWTIDSRVMAERYGTDLVRYYIATNFPENKEGDFTWTGFVDAVNNELVANLGNFVNRTLKFFEMKFAGELNIPDYKIDQTLQLEIAKTYATMAQQLEKVEIVATLETLLRLSRFGNKYFDDKKIWELIKIDPEAAKPIMLDLLNLVSNLEMLMQPFFPQACENFKGTLLIDGKVKQITETVDLDSWIPACSGNFKLTKPVAILFPKLDKIKVLAEKDCAI